MLIVKRKSEFHRKLAFVAILVALSSLIASCGSDLTAETSGRVTGSVLDRERKTTKRKTSSGKTKKTTKIDTETDIDYEYTVDGKSFSGYSEKDGDVRSTFGIGSAVTVCYNPKNPEESDVFAAETKCR